MTFKSPLWHPIAVVLTGINLVGVGYAVAAGEPWHAAVHVGLALVFGGWARRLRRAAGGGELADVRDQLEKQAVALEDARAALADQSAELTELQERVDFAERLLTQMRERPALEHREERPHP